MNNELMQFIEKLTKTIEQNIEDYERMLKYQQSIIDLFTDPVNYTGMILKRAKLDEMYHIKYIIEKLLKEKEGNENESKTN